MRKINQAGLELVKSFEGLRLNAYQDSVGVWTIGYGSTKGVKRGQRITEEEAEELLREDLATAERGVESAITEDITDNQFAACVSLAFNVGVGAFRKSSIVKYINAGDVLLAADRFLLYNRAGGRVLAGLTRRRKAERALFLTEDEQPDEPILNGEVEPAPEAGETTTEKVTTTVVEKPGSTVVEKISSSVSTLAGNEHVKEVASSGFGKLSLKVAGGSAAVGVLSAVGSWWKQNWQGVVFTLVFLGIAYLIYREIHRNKHAQKMEEARIKADKSLSDVQFK